jgi:hypothetical protein
LKLENRSSLETARLRSIISFVRPPGVRHVSIRVARGGPSGRYFSRGNIARVALPLRAKYPWIVPQYLGRYRSIAFPFRFAKHDAYLGVEVRDYEEVAVYLLAHELRHAWQARGPRIDPKYKYVNAHAKFDGAGVEYSATPFAGSTETRVAILKRRGREHAPRRGMVWGARGRFSERDADSYALRLLRAWRRANRSSPRIDDFLFPEVA